MSACLNVFLSTSQHVSMSACHSVCLLAYKLVTLSTTCQVELSGVAGKQSQHYSPHWQGHLYWKQDVTEVRYSINALP